MKTIHHTVGLLVQLLRPLPRDERGLSQSTDGHLYAAAGIPEYWVLDLNGRQLLVYRDPNSAASDYSTKLTLTDRDTVQPTAQPQGIR